jgi:hypothetical protein
MRGRRTGFSLPSMDSVVQGSITTIVIIVFIIIGIHAFTAPRSGTVESTWLEPAHWETYQSGSTCYAYSKEGHCTFSTPVYAERWVPDRCYLHLNDKEKSKREATWNIPCHEKDSYKIGSWVNLE